MKAQKKKIEKKNEKRRTKKKKRAIQSTMGERKETCVCVYIYTCLPTHIHKCIHTNTQTYTSICIYTCIYYIHTHIQTYRHWKKDIIYVNSLLLVFFFLSSSYYYYRSLYHAMILFSYIKQ